MSQILTGTCSMPGPYGAHCTDRPMHRYSCYDEGDDVAFNEGQSFTHDCDDDNCDTPHLENRGT